jgi:uncharacterized membrane protein YfcA
MKLIIIAFIIFALAVLMIMTGRGGGNFYVLTLVIAGIPMHEAAASGQFILFATALAAMFIFNRNRIVAWPIAIFIGATTSTMAFAGGYFSGIFSGVTLKFIFSGLLVCAGFLMLLPAADRSVSGTEKRLGFFWLKWKKEEFKINIWIALPATLAAGFGAGMVGVSGGSFLVPLMVLACRVPMRIAVATASAMVAATAFMGFVGHFIQGHFKVSWAVPMAFAAVLGGIIGGKIALKTKAKYLKKLFAYTTLAAAIFMVINALYSR